MTWLAGTSDVEIAGGEGWTVWAQRGLTQLTEAWGHTGETGIVGLMLERFGPISKATS